MNPLSALNFAAGAHSLPEMMQAGKAARPPAQELEQLQGAPGTISTAGVKPAGGNFENLLGDMVRDVNGKQAASADSVNGLMNGTVSLHQAMIAMEEASVSFQLMVEVRNKLLESYQELMRMQI